MRHTRHSLETVAIAAAIGSCIGLSNPAFAQSTPVPAGGSVILPTPEPSFGGVIGRKASESKPDFPKAATAPKGAPDILLILNLGHQAHSAGRSRRQASIGFTKTGCVTTSFTPPHCARRRGPPFSPAATITALASGKSRNLPPAIQATTRFFLRAPAPSATFLSTMVTIRRGSARNI